MLAAEQTRNEHVNSLGPDAALCITDRHGSQRIHFFKGRQLVEWNVDADAMVDGSLRDIDDRYPGLLARGFGRRIRAALHVPEWGPRIFFLFEGTKEFVVWDCAHGASREAAIPSQELLPCTLPAGEFTPVVAMTAAGQRVIYGFHGFEYVRWTVGQGALTTTDTGFPRRTAEDWKDGLVLAPRTGVYVEWTNRSNAHSNRKIYFFMGNLYLRWDVPSNTRNYRLDVVAGWKGWPAFASTDTAK